MFGAMRDALTTEERPSFDAGRFRISRSSAGVGKRLEGGCETLKWAGSSRRRHWRRWASRLGSNEHLKTRQRGQMNGSSTAPLAFILRLIAS